MSIKDEMSFEEQSVMANSVSTTGGIDFDTMCRDEIPGYSFNLVDLVDEDHTQKERKLERDTKKLSTKLKDTITCIEMEPIEKTRQVEKYYIGKTYILGSTFKSFDHMNHTTWVKKGIHSRYKYHSNKTYGCDGLVVLGAVTDKVLPSKRAKRVTKEDYALMLEQRLTHHQLIEESDDRVFNPTFNEGRRQAKKYDEDQCEKNAYAYAIYMAFACENSVNKPDDKQDDNPDDEKIKPLVTSQTIIKHDTTDSKQTSKGYSTKKKKSKKIHDPRQTFIHDYFKKSKQKVTFS